MPARFPTGRWPSARAALIFDPNLAGSPVAATSVAVIPVPEPSTFALLGLGAIGLVVYALRRNRSSASTIGLYDHHRHQLGRRQPAMPPSGCRICIGATSFSAVCDKSRAPKMTANRLQWKTPANCCPWQDSPHGLPATLATPARLLTIVNNRPRGLPASCPAPGPTTPPSPRSESRKGLGEEARGRRGRA